MSTNPAAEAARQIAALAEWLANAPPLVSDGVYDTAWYGADELLVQYPEIVEHADALRKQLEAIDPYFDEDAQFWNTVADSLEAIA